jgi:hypothetical protein
MKIGSILCAAALTAAAMCSTVFAGTQGDEPNDPIPFSGTSYQYNSADWTTTQFPTYAPACVQGGDFRFFDDVWICYTAQCTGLVTISTCGPAGAPDGTRIAFYDTCADPSQDPVVQEPKCCGDSECGKDASVNCEVICGQQYLIRIGLDPGTAPLSRKVTFVCEGEPCDHEKKVCAECCTRGPLVANFTYPTLVGTSFEDGDNEKVVHVFDASAYGAQTPGYWNPPVYEHADWTRAKLGAVFGVTLDPAGNIYVAHTGVFAADVVGAVGGGGAGAIYKLATATGTPSLFCTLPNTDPCAPGTTCAPGLGNLTYSCAHDVIYCTNIEDGRIYRISMAGVALEAYDFGDQAIEAATADPNDSVGPAPLGRRTWGVGVSGDRLYFAVWNEDQAFPSAGNNEIWSIPLTAGTGAFAGAIPTLEVSIPDYQTAAWSNPVADIAFDANCCMYLAERSQQGPGNPGYHVSRLLKYCPDAATGGYSLSSDYFETGVFGIENSAAGGVGIDLSPGGLVYATSDALAFAPQIVYGIIGLPQTGGVNANGLLIDMNGDVSQQDKSLVGSVEVACKEVDACTAEVEAKCHLGPDGLPDGSYELSMTIHNGMDSSPATLLLLPDLGTFVHLIPALQPGETRKVTLITNLLVPGMAMMDIGLFNGLCNECACCGVIGVEFEVPECECLLIEDLVITCHDDRDASTYWYDVTFTLRNISPWSARHLFIVPTDVTVTTTPQYVQLPFVLPGQTFPIAFTIKFPGAPPVDADGNWTTTISLSMHSANLSLCCKIFVDFTSPAVCSSGVLGDLNGDGLIDGADLGIMLADWGTVPLGGCPSDLNGDGQVDGADLGIVLSVWGN